MGKHTSEDGLFGNAPVADDADLVDGVGRLREGGSSPRYEDEEHEDPRHAPYSGRSADGESVPELHRV